MISQVIALAAGGILLLGLRAWTLPFGLLVPTAWLVGTGALAAERLLLAQIGLPWTFITLIMPWLPVAALAAWRLRLERRFHDQQEARILRRLASQQRVALLIEMATGIVIIVWTASLFRRAWSQPLLAYDAFTNWILKARALHHSGTVPASFFTDPHYSGLNLAPYAHLDYPLLVPLSVAHIYAWTGDNEVLAKGWWPLLAGAAVAGLYFGLDGLVNRAVRLGGLVLLMGMPAFIRAAGDDLVGMAELPIAVCFMYGALFMYRWLRKSEPAEFVLSALFFGMAGFTKNEGLPITLVGLALLLASAMLTRRISSVGKARISVALLLAALMVLPWQVYKLALGITGDMQLSLSALLENWAARVGPITLNLAWFARDINYLNFTWPLLPLLALVALAFARRRWLSTVPLLLLIVAHLGAVVLAYISTPHDLYWHLFTSADRLMFQPILVVALLCTIYLGLLLDKAESPPAPASSPAN